MFVSNSAADNRRLHMRTMRSLRRRNTYRHLRADYCLRRDLLPHAADRVANAVLAGAAGCEFKRPLAWLALLLVALERADASRNWPVAA